MDTTQTQTQQTQSNGPVFPPCPTADELNAHLTAGGTVLVATYLHATLYKPKHAGMFKQGKTGNLLVARGKHFDRLTSFPGRLGVAIRLG